MAVSPLPSSQVPKLISTFSELRDMQSICDAFGCITNLWAHCYQLQKRKNFHDIYLNLVQLRKPHHLAYLRARHGSDCWRGVDKSVYGRALRRKKGKGRKQEHVILEKSTRKIERLTWTQRYVALSYSSLRYAYSLYWSYCPIYVQEKGVQRSSPLSITIDVNLIYRKYGTSKMMIVSRCKGDGTPTRLPHVQKCQETKDYGKIRFATPAMILKLLL